MHLAVLTELGISIYEDDKCIKTFPFKNPVEDYVFIKKGESRLSDLIRYLSELDREVITNDEALLGVLKKTLDVRIADDEDIQRVQETKQKILVESGFADDESDAMGKLRDFAMGLSSSKVAEISSSPDLHIIQAISALDETDKIINGISSRLREWYGLHFPELDNIIDSINGYSQIVLAGNRKTITENDFESAGFPDSKIEMLSLIKERSRGGDISETNLILVQMLAKQILELFELRKKLEEQVDTEMEKEAPNLVAVLGSAVGARILARAGSLKKLATMPASTIQVLGAEKALFRSLKTGANPPKHGLLFQHATVHAAPRWQRGKIARAIAAKAAIASRVDVYKGGLNETLLEKLNVRVNEIGEKYKDAPVRKPREMESRPKSRFKDRDSSGFRKKKSGMKKKRRKNFGRR